MSEVSSAMRLIGVGVFASVLGLVLGGLGPRSEVRALKAQLEEVETCETSGIGRQLASAFQGRPWQGRGEDTEVRVERAPEVQPVAEGREATPQIQLDFGGEDGGPQPEDMEQGMEMMRDAMSLRQTQARAALDEEASPSDEQWDAIDGAIQDMNADLQDLAGELVDTLGSGQEPTRREAMLFAADTLDVMLEADERLYESLTPDQRENMAEDVIDPFAHIDPGVVDIFMELDRQ
jgi:hypothetical protein